MKNNILRQVLHPVLLAIGIVLIIGGIITGKHGATVIGIIVAAINVQLWIALYRHNSEKNTGSR